MEKKIDEIEAENFREECKDGLHKIVKRGDIPSDLWYELKEMKKEISGGCIGHWNFGCRDCEHNCERKAREKFMQKYNIEKIL